MARLARVATPLDPVRGSGAKADEGGPPCAHIFERRDVAEPRTFHLFSPVRVSGSGGGVWVFLHAGFVIMGIL